MNKIIISLGLLLLASCTSITVSSIDKNNLSQSICVINNPAVTIKGFNNILGNSFSQHGIKTVVKQTEEDAEECQTTLTYTALRSWDIIPYLSHAELYLWQNDKQIGSAIFHLKGKGGLSPAKFNSTQSKIDNLVSNLLKK